MIWPGRPNHDIEGWDLFSKKSYSTKTFNVLPSFLTGMSISEVNPPEVLPTEKIVRKILTEIASPGPEAFRNDQWFSRFKVRHAWRKGAFEFRLLYSSTMTLNQSCAQGASYFGLGDERSNYSNKKRMNRKMDARPKQVQRTELPRKCLPRAEPGSTFLENNRTKEKTWPFNLVN